MDTNAESPTGVPVQRLVRRLAEAAVHHEDQWQVWEHSWQETKKSLDWLTAHPEQIEEMQARLGSNWAQVKLHNLQSIKWARKQAALHKNRAAAIRSAVVALHPVVPPNDPSSATAATERNKCNQSGPPPFAEAHC